MIVQKEINESSDETNTYSDPKVSNMMVSECKHFENFNIKYWSMIMVLKLVLIC
jgi:hypothetical protein